MSGENEICICDLAFDSAVRAEERRRAPRSAGAPAFEFDGSSFDPRSPLPRPPPRPRRAPIVRGFALPRSLYTMIVRPPISLYDRGGWGHTSRIMHDT